MSYQFDIFISYRRHEETYSWIKDHFLPLLELRVGMELGRRPAIYVDDLIEAGTAWPAALGAALGTSRVLLVLWTKNYLHSRWCATELSHMIERDDAEKPRTVEHQHRLVLPAFIHDGEEFPANLHHLQHFEIQRTFNPRMVRNGALAEELDTILNQKAAGIAACIEQAPDWRKEWPQQAADALFHQLYQPNPPSQKTVPRFTAP